MFAWSRCIPKLAKCANNKYFVARHFRRSGACLQKREDDADPDADLAGSAATKYEIFVDEKSPIIFDIEQERAKYEINEDIGRAEKQRTSLMGISPDCGKTGVIELDELFSILKREKTTNICVINVPKEYSYVDYLVIATCRSSRHMRAVAEFVAKVYKYKTHLALPTPKIEGKTSNDWKAVDLGNIALHLMSQSAREYYDLEMLWTVGKEYDAKSIEKDECNIYDIESILQKLQPAVSS